MDEAEVTQGDPFVVVDGNPVDWTRQPVPAAVNDCDQCLGSPVPGAIPAMNTSEGIQRCDQCKRFRYDDDAALALAELVGGVVVIPERRPVE